MDERTDYTLMVSKPDEAGIVSVTSPEFPGLVEYGFADEAVSWAVDEIEKQRADSASRDQEQT